LTNTFQICSFIVYIKNTLAYNGSNNVNSYGGAVSDLSSSTDEAYVKIENFYTWNESGATSNNSGGLIFNSGSSFIDVKGNIRIRNKLYGGLIHTMPAGVLRIAGITYLKDLTADGLIVKDRTNGLIYSKGTGNDDGTGSSWKLIRNDMEIDDVTSWGEVVRLTESGDVKASASDTGTDYIIDESNLESGHYITVPTVDPSSISGRDDFIRLALHIQLKTASSGATGDALIMAGDTSATILGRAITIASGSPNIDLSGTGIGGLTRDNGANDAYTKTFDGNNKSITLAIGEAYGFKSNGTDRAVNINTGASGDKSTGRIYKHAYNGLFAKLGNGATIKNLTLDGSMHLCNKTGGNYFAGAFGAAIEGNSVTLNFQDAVSSVEFYLRGNATNTFLGGFISKIDGNNITLNFTDCTSDDNFYDNRADTGDNTIFCGGFVSMLSVTSQNIEVNFDTDTNNDETTGCHVSGSYATATDSNKETCNAVQAVKYGGLIAYIENAYNDSKGFKSYWNTRSININKLTIDGLEIDAKVVKGNKPNNQMGCAALLGYEWYGAEVIIADLTVKNSSISIMDGSRDSVKMAGLCTIATGHWQVDNVDIQSLDVSGQSSSFGMLVNSAFRPKDGKGMPALYLELTNVKNYTIASDSNVSISGIATGLYDELAVYTYCDSDSAKNVTTNGNSVISINTDANANSPTLIMDGDACNTYQNQTDYGKSIITFNKNSRYYYNLYYIRKKIENDGTVSNAEKLLIWSVYKYAHQLTYKSGNTNVYNGIEQYFTKKESTGTFTDNEVNTGNLDMTGLSYYPIDYTASFALQNNTTLKFFNEQIEAGETAGTGKTAEEGANHGTGGEVDDSLARTTSGTDSSHTQHYMMHCGLFRNYITGSKTFTTQNLTLEGSVGIYNGGSGFLIGGTLGGATNAVKFQPNSDSKDYTISLNGAYVTGATSASYAPLLINKVEKNTTLHLYGLKTTNTAPTPVGVYKSYATLQTKANTTDPDWYGATSLIGQVGASDGKSTQINLDFSKIVLDSRKPNAVLSTNNNTNTTANTALTTAYNSNYSIFKKATLLDSFIYEESCGGTYNYEYSEDWGNTKHQVTYGQEVTHTIDNNDSYPDVTSSQQLHYLGDRTHWTNPLDANRTSYYNFEASKFLPYVGDFETFLTNTTTHDTKYHELDVNLMVSSLDVGCGTYNDPYVISEAGQLLTLAKILKGDTIDPKFKVNLPDKDKTKLQSTTGDRNLYWCNADTDHITFYPDNGTYKRATDVENNPTTTNTYTSAQVRMYLAGAYYQITNDFTLSDKFAGLGVGDATTDGLKGAYAFHGVIVGKQGNLPKLDGTEGTELRYPVITNKSANPLIYTSNGSVIKNVTIKVIDVSKNILQDNPTTSTFAYNAGCNSYGAVIGKIMGGDNVIDNVPVTFKNTTFTLGNGAQVVPVGGYVGVVVNGGLFFRSMSGNISGLASSASSITLNGVSFGTGNEGILSSTKYLYINPIIGRVINGYAVTEDTYKPVESNVTMKNTTKNYSIADISTADTVTIGTDTITTDSAQDFFILSLIVNSGTGSKASALSYDNATFKATHIGTYADVGCKQTKKKVTTDSGDIPVVCDTDLFASGYTELTDASATPYITVKYTNSSANAQVITDSGKSYAINMSGTPWNMAYGYRGIGGFNSDNSSYQLGVTSLNSSGSTLTINLMSQYATYEQEYDNYPTAASCGFGLFNTFVPAANCTVANLKLTGQVKADVYDSTTSTGVVFTKDSVRDKYLNTGALAGIKSNNNAFTLDTVTIDNSSTGNVSSFQNSGGMIGAVSGTGIVTVKNCAGTSLNVQSAAHTGGFFGTITSPVRINNTAGTSSAISISSITQSNGRSNGASGWTTDSAGGLIGYATNSIIKNVTVSQVSGGTGITLSSSQGGAGGIIGTSIPSVDTDSIESCTVNDLTVTGRRTGVAVGQYIPSAVRTISIKNVVVNGKTGTGTNAIVERTSDGNVGTIIGYVDKSDVTVENCTSKNYTIKSNDGSTGGCIGYISSTGTIRLKNYLIDSCKFQSSSQNTGGIIGGTGGQILGYNIAMNAITKTNKYAADFIGSYSNKTLKIVGFSRNNTPTPSTANDHSAICSNTVCVSGTTQTELPSGSYIIFSDYNGIGYAGNNHTATPVITDNTSVNIANMITPYVPYATVNPYLKIDDNTKLTGDGIADTVSNLAITNILSDINNSASKAHTYAKDGGAEFSDIHLSTMNTQLGSGTVTNDFAILVLEDTNHYNSQALVNGYLQLLTNTRFNYADNTANTTVFTTQLYKMELQSFEEQTEGQEQSATVIKKFVKTGDANLKIDANHRFYMMNDKEHVDTGMTTMFSLIDIQFYDPTISEGTPDVVYHLYVPVLVKKMLKYSFQIATGSGTIYDKEWYGTPGTNPNRYEKILLENFGTPGTLYFTYSYERTLREWQEALDYGENLLLNYDKILSMKEVTASLEDMADDTVLTLVDTNQNDRCYYSRFSGAWADDELCLYKSTAETASAFKTSFGASGTAFQPVAICDLMNIKAEENATAGKFIKLNDATGATVRIGNDYYRLYDSATDVGENEPTTKYTLTVINKKGRKYISGK